MGLKKCENCGKVFVSKSQNLCNDCYQEELEKYRMLRDYLWENSQASIEELANATGISPKLIRKFIREDRFNLK
ncbi:hypothetical protein [Orenia marismortui]|uniref:Flagellar operon protein (TIGR03826 family) n=1 Tax=Orenia marismortui TaxID=46469 RepID=A0A4R8HFU7_9FIRM|nr:hypothetical protein [Orenia marismortui]TDX58892.1 hypothetical protein C7959_10230 [Orenia marismortui]